MSEFDSKVSQHILSLLEGETIRVILHDGTAVEGKLLQVRSDILRLGDQTIPLDRIATYYVLKDT